MGTHNNPTPMEDQQATSDSLLRISARLANLSIAINRQLEETNAIREHILNTVQRHVHMQTRQVNVQSRTPETPPPHLQSLSSSTPEAQC
jgi:hypothetical protein